MKPTQRSKKQFGPDRAVHFLHRRLAVYSNGIKSSDPLAPNIPAAYHPSQAMSLFLQPRLRSRACYLLAVLATIIAGLASRRFPNLLPSSLGKYPGDALWSLMVFFGWAIIFRRAPTLRIAVLALATSCTIEALKLCQSPWLVSFRYTTLGHLIFGQAFSWQNLIAYAIGGACGLIIEIFIKPADPARSAGL